MGVAWRSTEYLVAFKGVIYKCRTVRRRADDLAFKAALIDNLGVIFEDYTLKGAKTSTHVSFAKALGGNGPAQIPMSGPGIVPRIVYLMPGDLSTHGLSQGFPDCIYAQNAIGPKRNHSEDCRRRMEEEISKDASDTRAEKGNTKTRSLYCTADSAGR